MNLGTAVVAQSIGNSNLIENATIRLWLHFDGTKSFKRSNSLFAHSLVKWWGDFANDYPNMRIGLSVYGDRVRKGYKSLGCFRPIFSWSKLRAVKAGYIGDVLSSHYVDTGTDEEEDGLSTLPYLAKRYFPDPKKNEYSFLVYAGDYPPKYHNSSGMYDVYDHCGRDSDLKWDPAEWVYCENYNVCLSRYLTLDEIFASVLAKNIFPIAMMRDGPRKDIPSSLSEMEFIFTKVGYKLNETAYVLPLPINNTMRELETIIRSRFKPHPFGLRKLDTNAEVTEKYPDEIANTM